MADRGRPPLLPSLLLGIGFGGFIDGIVLHQILQWHHMLSAEGCCPTSTVLGRSEDDTPRHLPAPAISLTSAVPMTDFSQTTTP